MSGYEPVPTVLIAVQEYPDGGGIAAIVENLISLLANDMEVHLAVVNLRPDAAERAPLAPNRLHVLGGSRIANPLLMPGSLLFAVRVTRWLRGLVRELQPDALLAQDALDLSTPAVFATHGTSTRTAVMDHGRLSNALDRRWQRMIVRRQGLLGGAVFAVAFALDTPWRALRWRLGLRLADAAWYVGYELAPQFARAGGRGARYSQMPPRDFVPPNPEDRSRARASLGLERDQPVVNMVTRLDGEKDLGTVIEVVAEEAVQTPSLRVLVAGDGTMRGWMQTELERRHLDHNVTLLGRLSRDEVRRLHHASDFHLYAGYIGCGMSIALLEAMSCGVIPIVSDVPFEHRELVDDAGWVFPAGDRAALSGALRAALDSPSTILSEMRAASVARVAEYDAQPLRSLVDGLVSSSR